VPPDTARVDTLAVTPADTVPPVPADSLVADTLAVAPDSLVAPVDSLALADPTLELNSGGEVSPREWFVVTARVDTSNADIRAILRTWRNYMIARYEGRDGGWLWNAEERQRWSAFSLFAPYIFNVPDFFGSRRATILSVEPDGDRYVVRTLVHERSIDGTTSRRDPWAIVRVCFEKENEQWWIRNAIDDLTEGWMKSHVRFITYHYPKSHPFDLARAMRAVSFCDSIVDQFPFLSRPPFDLYITTSPEEVDRLLGLEYYVLGNHRSVALTGRGIVITSSGSEWNPREMLRMLMGRELAPHPVVSDGFAGWVGGWNGRPYREAMRPVAAYLAANDSIQFDDIISVQSFPGPPGVQYAPGAVLCDLAWSMNGNEAIFRLFQSGPSPEGLYAAIQDIFGVDRDRFQYMWRARVRELR
jgi:hypothetical protein